MDATPQTGCPSRPKRRRMPQFLENALFGQSEGEVRGSARTAGPAEELPFVWSEWSGYYDW